MEAGVEPVRSGDQTQTSCTHERTCVRAANALTNWATRQIVLVSHPFHSQNPRLLLLLLWQKLFVVCIGPLSVSCLSNPLQCFVIGMYQISGSARLSGNILRIRQTKIWQFTNTRDRDRPGTLQPTPTSSGYYIDIIQPLILVTRGRDTIIQSVHSTKTNGWLTRVDVRSKSTWQTSHQRHIYAGCFFVLKHGWMLTVPSCQSVEFASFIKLNLLGVLFVSLHLRFGMICQLMYNLVSQFMFLNRDSNLSFLTVHLTELTDGIWSSKCLCI